MIFRYERQLTGVAGLARLAQAEFVGTASTREVRLRKRVKRKVARSPTRSANRLSCIQSDTLDLLVRSLLTLGTSRLTCRD